MALTPDEIKSTYPLPVYNYKVNIGDATIAFSEVSGLNIEQQTITYKESPTSDSAVGPVTMHMPGQGTPVNVTLRKGIVGLNTVQLFFNWINSIQLNQVEKRDITVSLCDETGAPVVVWTVQNAFPTNLEAPSFGADSNEVAVDSLTLMADGLIVGAPS